MSDYKLVPIKPTEAMCSAPVFKAMETVKCDCGMTISAGISANKARKVYEVMLQEAPEAVDVVREAAERVVKAFTSLGSAHDVVANMQRHRECEAAMAALQAALGEGK